MRSLLPLGRTSSILDLVDGLGHKDWDWGPEYKFDAMLEDMLTNLERKLSE